jgi:hypothetical protein
MLKKFIFSLTAVMALSLVVMAQDKGTKVTGYIVDKHCSAADMATHGKSCVTSPDCLKSGLGVYADGKFTPFDEKSAAQAKAALEKSKKDKGAKFNITGKVINGKFAADTIEEAL